MGTSDAHQDSYHSGDRMTTYACPCGSTHIDDPDRAQAHSRAFKNTKGDIQLRNDRKRFSIVAVLCTILPLPFIPLYVIRAFQGKEEWSLVGRGIICAIVLLVLIRFLLLFLLS